MGRKNIHYHTSGFLKEIPYHADMLQFLSDYKDKFGGAESLDVYLDEIPFSMLSFPRGRAIEFSEDGKSVIIKYSTHKYYDRNGKVTSTPSVFSIYDDLKFLLDKAVKEYTARFTLK